MRHPSSAVADGLASLPFSFMALEVLARVCAGLFAGASIYITAVEHPARLACVVGLLAAVGAWWRAGHTGLLVGGLLLGAVVPFTLLGILPTNRRLLARNLDPESAEAAALLARWGRLHAVRSVLGGLAFGTLLVCVAQT